MTAPVCWCTTYYLAQRRGRCLSPTPVAVAAHGSCRLPAADPELMHTRARRVARRARRRPLKQSDAMTVKRVSGAGMRMHTFNRMATTRRAVQIGSVCATRSLRVRVVRLRTYLCESLASYILPREGITRLALQLICARLPEEEAGIMYLET